WYMGLDDDDKTAVDEEVQQRVSQISLIWDEMRQYLSRALSEWFDAFREEMRPVFDAFSEAAASATALLDEEE
ncbi:MAG: hypothetical protein GY803_10470, partial [Chloroflexi bacterium]|nr:hypothetical protein [Chloroflexota bacterium]